MLPVGLRLVLVLAALALATLALHKTSNVNGALFTILNLLVDSMYIIDILQVTNWLMTTISTSLLSRITSLFWTDSARLARLLGTVSGP